MIIDDGLVRTLREAARRQYAARQHAWRSAADQLPQAVENIVELCLAELSQLAIVEAFSSQRTNLRDEDPGRSRQNTVRHRPDERVINTRRATGDGHCQCAFGTFVEDIMAED